jgi:2-oxoisovalerate dehydrogenase E1 component
MKKTNLIPETSWCKWNFTKADLKSIDSRLAAKMLFDVILVNEFEHALLDLKNDDCIWGPVHTSVGQEAISAGAVAAVLPSDKFLGTHRAHHQFLIKVMHSVLPESWDPVNKPLPKAGREAIYRTMSEIMGLADGYCGGRGGSMHLRCPEAGFLGSNAIVGGGVPIAVGAAFTEKFNKTGNIVVCFFGDGATNQGAFHEACNMAGAWDLPVVFFLENNEYAVGTSAEHASKVKDLSVRASSYGMDGHVVDGNDPVAVYKVMKKAADQVRKGKGPCMIEAKCYRRYHHAGDQPGSAFGYRCKEEEEDRSEKEALARFPEALIDAKILTKNKVAKIRKLAVDSVAAAVGRVIKPGSPMQVRDGLAPDTETVADGVRSNGEEWADISYSERSDFSSFEDMRYSDAIAAATGRWMEKDPQTVVMGEEVASFGGGAYGATKDLPAKYPDRILNTPISEAGFVGLGLGAAMTGMRPIVELMFGDFVLVAADQVFNQVGKARHMYGNTTDLPIVIRTRLASGLGYGGQHSMDPVGLYALFPGIRIVAPSNAFDYIGLFNSAMHSLDPVLMLEHNAVYAEKTPAPVGELDYFIPFGKARKIEEGSDVTMVTYGAMVPRCEKLLESFKEEGVSAELIDLRTVDYPSIDYDTIGESLQKTGVVVIVEEASHSLSLGSVMAKEITERYFDHLDGPVTCIASPNVPTPVSRVLEAAALLGDQEIFNTTIAAAKRER